MAYQRTAPRWAAAWLVGVLSASCQPSSFACDDDADCAADGQCQWSNYCAFPDAQCDSGLRYGEHAGEFSDLCVVGDAGETSSGAAAAASSTGADSSADADADAGSTSGGVDTEGATESGEPALCTCMGKPPGWQGPALLQTGAVDATLADCPAVAPVSVLTGFDGLQVPASQCTGGSQCTALLHVSELECDGGPTQTIELSTGACPQLPGPDIGAGLFITVEPGSCQCEAAGSRGELSTPTWTVAGQLCAPTQSECEDDGVCLPEPDPLQGESVCIFQTGIVSCPLVGYTEQLVFYEGYVDGRECESCAGGDDECIVAIGDPDCGNPYEVLDGNGELCTSFGGEEVSAWPVAGDELWCGERWRPTGEVTATAPTTACCVP